MKHIVDVTNIATNDILWLGRISDAMDTLPDKYKYVPGDVRHVIMHGNRVLAGEDTIFTHTDLPESIPHDMYDMALEQLVSYLGVEYNCIKTKMQDDPIYIMYYDRDTVMMDPVYIHDITQPIQLDVPHLDGYSNVSTLLCRASMDSFSSSILHYISAKVMINSDSTSPLEQRRIAIGELEHLFYAHSIDMSDNIESQKLKDIMEEYYSRLTSSNWSTIETVSREIMTNNPSNGTYSRLISIATAMHNSIASYCESCAQPEYGWQG